MNKPNDEQNSASAANTPRPPRGRVFQLAALGLMLVGALACMGLAYLLKSPNEAAIPEGKGIPAYLFQGWGKPDFVIVLSAQQQGYMLPCGCSSPQKGGLERRYNFIQLLKARGWPVVAVDLGDVPQKRGIAHLPNVQGLIKYRYSMTALKEMGYLAVGVGEYEAGDAWPLAQIEGAWAANSPQPAVLAANLKDADKNFPLLKAIETQTVPGTNVKVGATSIVGPTVIDHIKDPNVKFTDSKACLLEQLNTMRAEKVDLPILLYHGEATGRQEAIKCAETFPQFPIILALSEADEPPAYPIAVDRGEKARTRNYVFRLGKKGKFIGVVGVYRNGPNFNFKYQLVEMIPEYETPVEQKKDQPIAKLMEDYTRALKHDKYLERYIQVRHTLQALDPVKDLKKPGDGMPHYIGSDACASCHRHAYDVWSASKHSEAYQTLVDAKHPSLRQYDGECIVCHTVGFGYKTGFVNEKNTPDLKNVGCESCHGPGSLHAANPKNEEWRERMSLPWLNAKKTGNVQAKNRAIEQKLCVTCHDIDNDVHWVREKVKDPNTGKWVETDPFIEKWVKGKIIHNNPPKKN